MQIYDLIFTILQHVTDGATDARIGRVQCGHLRRVWPAREPRLVPRMPLLRRRLHGRDALRLQVALPRAGFYEYCP